MSDHGLVMPLTPTPDETERHIEVHATHGPTDETTLATEVEARLDGIRERSRQRSLEIRNRSTIRLGGIESQRVAVRYYNQTQKAWYIEDFIEALRTASNTRSICERRM